MRKTLKKREDTERPVSNKNDQDRSSAFGCGGIDLHGPGPKGPPDMGGLASLLAILTLPFILRLWRQARVSDIILKNN